MFKIINYLIEIKNNVKTKIIKNMDYPEDYLIKHVIC